MTHALVKKKILVTGASGFIGRQVVLRLIEFGHEIIATSRALPEELSRVWGDRVKFVPFDLSREQEVAVEIFGCPDVLIHLAWRGLHDYKNPAHIDEFLPEACSFIKRVVESGTQHVVVAGTCFEYGFQYGPMDEAMPANPTNAYGIAKDALRRYIQTLQSQNDFTLAWVRLFYMYGPGQHPKSILSLLDKAVSEGLATFNMSGGEQLRDYLSVEEVARRLAVIAGRSGVDGVFNCCSGRPISIRRLVEERVANIGASIDLNLGHFPYPQHEPMAFWGCPKKTAGYFVY